MTHARPAWLFRFVAFLLLLAVLAPASPVLPARAVGELAIPTRAQSPKHALLFVTDGGRPDYFRQFAARGLLPAFARLQAEGAMGANGMLPQLPTSTRVGVADPQHRRLGWHARRAEQHLHSAWA